MFNENDVILLFTMAHKQCHLLISRCKIGDFTKESLLTFLLKPILRLVREHQFQTTIYVWQNIRLKIGSLQQH